PRIAVHRRPALFRSLLPPPARSTLFPYTTLFRSSVVHCPVSLSVLEKHHYVRLVVHILTTHISRFLAPKGFHVATLISNPPFSPDRKSTRLNSSHVSTSYAVFCLKKKKKTTTTIH